VSILQAYTINMHCKSRILRRHLLLFGGSAINSRRTKYGVFVDSVKLYWDSNLKFWLLAIDVRLKISVIHIEPASGGSRKKYLGGGPGPSSFGRQPPLSEITIEAISGVLPKFRWVYARNVAPSSERDERWKRHRGSRRREAWGSWEGVSPSTPSPAD